MWQEIITLSIVLIALAMAIKMFIQPKGKKASNGPCSSGCHACPLGQQVGKLENDKHIPTRDQFTKRRPENGYCIPPSKQPGFREALGNEYKNTENQ